MGLKQIRLEGDDILKKRAKPVKEITPQVLQLLDDMYETMQFANGVGIAAPQVGVLKRIAIIKHEDEFFELINPQIIATEGTQICNEACLSVPGLCGDIERPLQITVTAQDRTGTEYTVTVSEFLASVFCHELDHLDGILYRQNATNIRPSIIEEEAEETVETGRYKKRFSRRQNNA